MVTRSQDRGRLEALTIDERDMKMDFDKHFKKNFEVLIGRELPLDTYLRLGDKLIQWQDTWDDLQIEFYTKYPERIDIYGEWWS